jgi:hypothetical protein
MDRAHGLHGGIGKEELTAPFFGIAPNLPPDQAVGTAGEGFNDVRGLGGAMRTGAAGGKQDQDLKAEGQSGGVFHGNVLCALFSDGHRTTEGLIGGGIGAADCDAVGGGIDIAGDGLFGRRIIAGNVDGGVATAGREESGDEEWGDVFFHPGLFSVGPLWRGQFVILSHCVDHSGTAWKKPKTYGRFLGRFFHIKMRFSPFFWDCKKNPIRNPREMNRLRTAKK